MFSSRISKDLAPSTASHLVISSSTSRKTLTLFPSSNDTITLSNDPGVTAGAGITLLPGVAPVYLDVDYHGSCVQNEWYAIYASGLNPLVYIEAMM